MLVQQVVIILRILKSKAKILGEKLAHPCEVHYVLGIRKKGGSQMPKVLVSLDEIDRVKRLNNIRTKEQFAEVIGVHRNTLRVLLRDRKIDDLFVNRLVELGARPNKILVLADLKDEAPIAA